MQKTINIKRILPIINMLIILCISVICFFALPFENLVINYKKSLFIISWIINIVFVYQIFTIYKIKKNILDFNIIFLIFIFLFCNGQVLLYSFGISDEDLWVLKVTESKKILKAAIYFYFSNILLYLGILTQILMKNDRANNNYDIEDKSYIKAINIFAGFLTAASAVPYMYIFIKKAIVAISLGYENLYNENAVEVYGPIGYLSNMFIPSLYMLMFANKRNTNLNRFITLFLILTSGVSLLAGGRGGALTTIVILLILNNTFIKKLSKKSMLKLILAIIVIIIIIPVIFQFRGEKNKTFSGFFDMLIEVASDKENNFIVSTISELGGTMHAFILTESVIPSQIDYKLGESYIASILMIIPSFLMGGYSFAPKAALDHWLKETHNMSYGPGFNIVAETYYNFGTYGGVLFSFVIGFFFASILNKEKEDNDKNVICKMLSLIFLYNSLLVARNPFHSCIRNYVYMYVVPYMAIMIIYNTLKKRESINKSN